jgi:hypothetical protein
MKARGGSKIVEMNKSRRQSAKRKVYNEKIQFA